MKQYDYLIVGSGLFGAVFALSKARWRVPGVGPQSFAIDDRLARVAASRGDDECNRLWATLP